MKRYMFLMSMVIFSCISIFSQDVIDDMYFTASDTKVKSNRYSNTKNQRDVKYKNGAKEIQFFDSKGNVTTGLTDSVLIINDHVVGEDNDTIYSDEADERVNYLNEFKGDDSDYEYAERIRRFHNPKYTITISDPNYNDIYLLDDNYWNVYTDGFYATITPTWINPYWWNYSYSPYLYSSWYWRSSLYSPWSFAYSSWYSPWYGGYYDMWGAGYYDPYYYGWNRGYYYGGDYNYYSTTDRQRLNRGTFSGVSNIDSRKSLSPDVGSGSRNYSDGSRTKYGNVRSMRSSAVRSDYERTNSNRNSTNVRYGIADSRSSHSTPSRGIDTRMRTGSVRSSNDWNRNRDSRGYYRGGGDNSRTTTVITNRSNPYNSRSRGNYTTNSRSSHSNYSPSNYSSSRSSSYNSTPYRSSSRSSGTGYSSGRSSYSSSRSSGGSSSYRSSGSSSRSSSSGSYGGSNSRSSGGRR